MTRRTSAQPSLDAHLPPLDGLRGIAILSVMAFHFTWTQSWHSRPAKLVQTVGALGWAGVDLFFVLSGFLITGILLGTRSKPGYFKNFYARRVLRIFPLYYGVLFAALVVGPVLVPFDTPELARLRDAQGWLWSYSLNISVWADGRWLFDADWVHLNHFWSLAVEEHFYLVWPLLVFLLSPRALLFCSLGLAVLGPLLRASAWALGVPAIAVFSATPMRVDALAMGGALAVAVRDPALLPRIVRASRWAVGLALAAYASAVAAARYPSNLARPIQTVGFSALAVMSAAIVLMAITAAERSPLRRALTHPTLLFFGKYSYGAYVFHELLHPAYDAWFGAPRLVAFTGSEFAASILFPVLAAGATLLVAVVSFEAVERHFLSLKRFFETREPTAALRRRSAA